MFGEEGLSNFVLAHVVNPEKWMEFISSMTGILVWPIVVIVILFAFKASINEIILLVKRMKFKDVELEFEQKKNNDNKQIDADTTDKNNKK